MLTARSLLFSLAAGARRLARELTRFGSVGLAAFALTLGLFNLLHGVLGLGPLTSNGLATATATLFSYAANRHWTFRHRESSGTGREYALFFALNGIGLLITQAFLGVVTYALGLRGPLESNAALVAGTGAATFFRFYAYRRWVFRSPAASAVTPARTPARQRADLKESAPLS